MIDKQKNFMALLESQYKWPSKYRFKFIVPRTEIDTIKEIIGSKNNEYKETKSGHYLSVTAERQMESPQDVLDYYKKVANIKGVISL